MKIMRTPFMKKWLAAVLCLLALGSTAALAGPDTFYLGDGHNGPLTVTTLNTRINTYAQVTANLAANTDTIPVGAAVGAATSIPRDSLIMILQTTGIDPIPASGDTAPINLDGKPVGAWELARVKDVSGSTLTLTAPLVRGYTALVTQVIVVPEYTSVTINASSSISALSWDGSRGGVVAFLAQDVLTLLGSGASGGRVVASAVGFRGGAFVFDPSDTRGCSDLDQSSPTGGLKGEGIANTRYGSQYAGRGNLANGGGGGVCELSGGGGGAGAGTSTSANMRAGAGGLGGNSVDDARQVGGLGGAPLFFTALNRLTFGGGGGAGHSASSTGQPAGNGGGIVFVRARQLTGAGRFDASGATPDQTSEAGGGGGGGGTLHLRFAETANCNVLEAFGGAGGRTTESDPGPGGGGGGGYVFFQSAGGTCTPRAASISGANPGSRRTGTTTDATAGNNGYFVRWANGFVAPVIQTPSNGAVLNVPVTTVTGTAEANSSLTLKVNGETYVLAVPASGLWSTTLNAPLSDGTYTATAVTTNSLGEISPTATSTFTVDTTAPAVPAITAPAQGALLNTPVTTVTGSAEPGSKLTLVVAGTTYPELTVPASGNWSVTLNAPLSDGTYTATATARDAAGNTSPTATSTFTVDTTPPPVAITAPGPGALLNTPVTTVTGSAEPGSKLTVVVAGTTYPELTVPASGNWSVTLNAPLSDGTYTATATARDAAGNTSAPATSTFTVDTTPPAVAITAPVNGAVLNTPVTAVTGSAEPGSKLTLVVDGTTYPELTVPASGLWSVTLNAPLSNGPYTATATTRDAAGNTGTATSTFTVDTTAPAAPVITAPANGAVLNTPVTAITGTGEPGSSLTVVVGGQTHTVTIPASGTWSVPLSPALSDGSYTVTATTRDAAGNTSPTATSTFTVDTQAPAVPVIVTPANGAVLSASPAAISGTAEKNTTLTLVLNNGTTNTTYTLPVDASGNWILTSPSLPTLGNGPYTVTATTRDAAGNTSPTATSTFTVDSTIPGAPVILTPPNGAVLNASPTAITGSAEPGSRLTLVINGTSYGPVTVDATGNWTFSPPNLADGPYTVTATTTNAAGTTSPTATSTFTVDSTPPSVPVVTGPANGATVTDTTPVITGTADPGTTVTVIIDGVAMGTAPVDASGNWSYTPATPLTPGPHTVTARAEDTAGNTSPESPGSAFTVVQDTTAPETNITTGPSGTTPNRSATFEFDAGEPGVTYECRLDGGEWTPCTSPVTYNDLPEGEHTFEVRARDSEGNVDSTPATQTWTVRIGDVDFRGDGFGCSASGGDSSLVLMALGSVLALARRRRQR